MNYSITAMLCISPLVKDCFFSAFQHVLGLHLLLIPLLVLVFQRFQSPTYAYVPVPIPLPHFRSSTMGSAKYLSLNPMMCSHGHTVYSMAPEVQGESSIHLSTPNEE